MPLILDHNVRNTKQIANAFQPLVDHPMRFLGGDGPAVKFVVCSRDDAMDFGDDEIDRLLGRRMAPRRRCSVDHRQPAPRAERATSRG